MSKKYLDTVGLNKLVANILSKFASKNHTHKAETVSDAGSCQQTIKLNWMELLTVPTGLTSILPCIESNIDSIKSSIKNLGDDYATVNHIHDEYAMTNDVNAVRDSLGSKADVVHTHKEYAPSSHVHDEYAEKKHIHDGYAPSSHTHKASAVIDLSESIKKYLLSDVFKVGYVWASYTNTSPASILGGTWTEIKGVFPYYNASTATGGSNTHRLSSGEMPTHKHDARVHITGSETKGYGLAQSAGFKDRVVVAYGGYGYNTGDVGGNGSHNNMPKYQSVYAWRRSA